MFSLRSLGSRLGLVLFVACFCWAQIPGARAMLKGSETPVSELTAEEIASLDWSQPFPMVVYGSLRQGFSNHERMGFQVGAEVPAGAEYPFPYQKMRRAFLPGFVASGLTLKWDPTRSAPAEVYFYRDSDWKVAIGPIDDLESFSPEIYAMTRNGGDYIRVLVWVHLLPEDYTHYWFGEGSVWSYRERDLEIPSSDWGSYPRVACWLYLDPAQAKRSSEGVASPLIWPSFSDRL